MSKRESNERIAELYLYELRKQERQNKRGEFLSNLFLDSFLKRKNIFFDQTIINEVVSMLEKKGFIKRDDEAMSILYYEKQESMFDIQPENIKSFSNNYSLTLSGRDFVDQKQKLDMQRVKDRKENKKKWVERLISFLISVGVFIIGRLLGF